MRFGIVISQPLCYNIVIQFIFYEDFPIIWQLALSVTYCQDGGDLKTSSPKRKQK